MCHRDEINDFKVLELVFFFNIDETICVITPDTFKEEFYFEVRIVEGMPNPHTEICNSLYLAYMYMRHLSEKHRNEQGGDIENEFF